MEPTQVNSAFLADLRECLSRGEISSVEKLSPSGYSIGGLVQLACIKSACPIWFRTLVEKWEKSSSVLARAITILEKGQYPPLRDMWGVRGLEFFPVRGKNWADPIHYHPFESRFCKAAKRAGFGDKAEAFAGALYEMADNVVQHSSPDPSCSAVGLIGYYICDHYIGFAIADLGRGVLNSLRENPAWNQIPNSKTALMEVVTNHASRRQHGGDGEGFKEVFRSLVNMNGTIDLFSGDGRVRVVSTREGRSAMPQFTGAFPGFQLSVNCSLTANDRERIFPLDFLT